MFEKSQRLRHIWNYLIVKFLSNKSVPLKQILAETHADFQEAGPLLLLLGQREKDAYSLKIEKDDITAQPAGFRFNEEAAKREVQLLEQEVRKQDIQMRNQQTTQHACAALNMTNVQLRALCETLMRQLNERHVISTK